MNKHLKSFIKKLRKLYIAVFCIRSIELLRHKVTPSTEHIKALNLTKEDIDFFVDIGANRGQFTLIANIICPGRGLIIFEPLPDETALTLRFLDLKKIKYSFYPFGLGNNGIKYLKFNIAKKSDCSSFLKPSETGLATKSGKLLQTFDTIDVCIKDLDQVLTKDNIPHNSHGFMKIDTQGTELDVIKGGKTFITKYIKYIYVEVSEIEHYDNQTSASEIHTYLCSIGFKYIDSFNIDLSQDGILAYADVLYVNSKII